MPSCCRGCLQPAMLTTLNTPFSSLFTPLRVAVKEVEAIGELDNTYIIYTSDNGKVAFWCLTAVVS